MLSFLTNKSRKKKKKKKKEKKKKKKIRLEHTELYIYQWMRGFVDNIQYSIYIPFSD